jgi:hypothetical protein
MIRVILLIIYLGQFQSHPGGAEEIPNKQAVLAAT